MKNCWQVKYYFDTHDNFGTDEKLLALKIILVQMEKNCWQVKYYFDTHDNFGIDENILAFIIILVYMKILLARKIF
jgi:uncharacterized protein YjbK